MIFGKKQEDQVAQQRSRKKEPEDDYEWDKRRIGIFLLCFAVIILVGLEAKRKFFPNTKILGASVSREIQKPTVEAPHVDFSRVGSSIEDIKRNIQSLDAQDIASSSPQIQKVLHDIQGIKDLPANQAREVCQKLCSGI